MLAVANSFFVNLLQYSFLFIYLVNLFTMTLLWSPQGDSCPNNVSELISMDAFGIMPSVVALQVSLEKNFRKKQIKKGQGIHEKEGRCVKNYIFQVGPRFLLVLLILLNTSTEQSPLMSFASQSRLTRLCISMETIFLGIRNVQVLVLIGMRCRRSRGHYLGKITLVLFLIPARCYPLMTCTQHL